MKRLFFLMSVFLFAGVSHADTYSQIVTVGNTAYVSLQLPINPSTGEIVESDIQTLTGIALDHVDALLRSKGFKMKNVIKTEVYLKDIRDYTGMNSVYGQRFAFPYPPARDVVEVADLLYNAPIGISCIAVK